MYRRHERRHPDLSIDEVQTHAALALPVGLFAILAYWLRLVAFQMPLPARQTSRPHSSWLLGAALRRRHVLVDAHGIDAMGRAHARTERGRSTDGMSLLCSLWCARAASRAGQTGPLRSTLRYSSQIGSGRR